MQSTPSLRFKHHLFLCLNSREEGDCCAARGSPELLKALKRKIRDRGLDGPGGVMATKSGCLGLCSGGPNLVVYPRGSWHVVRHEPDLDALLDSLPDSPIDSPINGLTDERPGGLA